ncbi:hypothetical protein KAU33_05975, partial [Candidatus Dependentiae bacterium]|nr:hypothetical protein [Candidatus Dependentiae bacterium]
MLEKQKEYKATKEELEDYDRIITKINQGKVVQIRKALNDYDKKFPNSPYLHNLYWGFINISQDLKSLGYFEVNKEHRELFRSYINKLDLLTQKLAALTIYQKLFDLKLNLYCEESFTSTDDVKVNFNLKKLNKVNFKVYKIYLEESLLPLERVPVSGVTLDKNNLIKEFERTFNKDYEGFISLGKFDSGIYVVFAESEGLISGTYIKVSNMGVIAKADSKKMVFFVYDKISGKPLKDVIIPVFSGFNLYGYGKTDENGIALMLKRQKDKNLSFRVAFHKDGDLTFLRSHFYYNYNETYRSGCTSYKVYFYTDRPIYRPDQKVFFKCIVREQRNVLSYSVPKNLSVRLKIISSKGKIVYNKVLECNGFGTINGEFELLEDADLGIYSYQISSETRNKYLPYINGSAFWVEEYKKPEFEVKLIPDKDHYIKGDYVTINMNASYYFGGPVQDSEVEYKISYRKLFPFDSLSNSDNYRLANKTSAFKEVILKEGKIQTDSEGKCKIKFKTLDLDYSSIYIIETKLTDSSRRVVENTVKIKVDLVGFSILVRTDKRIYDPGEKIKIYYSGIKSGNKTKEFSGNLILGRYIWADDKVTFKIIKTDEIKSSGKIIPYIATINEPGNYLVKITSKDVDGNQISGEIGFYICNKQLEENFKFKTLKLISDKDKYKYNETARLI